MSITSKVLTSAWLSSGSKLLGKALGLLSTLLLARILTPSDFGLIAAISIALYFFDVLANASTEEYVIRKKSVSQADLSTAWSFNLLLKSAICVLLLILAPILSSVLDKPEITEGLRVAAIILPLNAIKSPALLLLKRHLMYSGLFWLSLTEKIFSFFTVVSFAVYLQSYWAFIIADIVAALAGIVFSYRWFRKTPRFNLSEISGQWRFSSWMLGKNIAGYLRAQIDTIIVSRYFSSASLGQYNLTREVSMLAGHYLLAPAIEPLLSAFRHSANSQKELMANTAFCCIIVLFVGLPIATFMSFFAEPVINLLLGSQWEIAQELLPVMAWLLVYWSILHVVETALLAQSQVKLLFFYDCFALVTILVCLLLVVVDGASLIEVALCRVVVGALSAFCLILFAFHLSLFHLFKVTIWGTALFGTAYISAIFASTLFPLQLLNIDNGFFSNLFNTAISGLLFCICYLFFSICLFYICKSDEFASRITTLFLQYAKMRKQE